MMLKCGRTRPCPAASSSRYSDPMDRHAEIGEILGPFLSIEDPDFLLRGSTSTREPMNAYEASCGRRTGKHPVADAG